MNTRQFNRNRIGAHLKKFEYRKIFIEELGWDRADELITLTVGNCDYTLDAIAEKRGFRVYQVKLVSDEDIPIQSIRKAIEIQVSRIAHEHILIFASEYFERQAWQWVKRQQQGQRYLVRTHWYQSNQSGELLVQKLEYLKFNLDQEDEISLLSVTQDVSQAFDTEKVTKKFYDEFKKEHKNFLNSINGINRKSDTEWYASIMLNRMMFIYFVQKRGFLDGDVNYLRTRLDEVRKQYGSGTFQNFYRDFLLRLFHEGINQPSSERSEDFTHLFGDIPYLNGGLFDFHDLEREYCQIEIPDSAFEETFQFFDKYDWHLDDRPLRNDNEINPDVIGYIFEKYINQKEKAAYYTPEDVTGYITRNSIIPQILDTVQKRYPKAFSKNGDIWKLISNNPDRYIFETNRYGMTCNTELPMVAGDIDKSPNRRQFQSFSTQPSNDEIEPSDSLFSLPTEKPLETYARHRRYQELVRRMESREIDSIDSLVTNNLDLETFLSDVISGSNDIKLVWEIWESVKSISILDPTCGSGAFLFSALNILVSIYSTCVDTMREIVGSSLKKIESEKFHETLSTIDLHANEDYFILKTIVVNNLYGVDIMDEAVEICKLRLFLKLVAQLEAVDQIEPLPDIDFNIRAGNALVGLASEKEVTNDIFGSSFNRTIKSIAREIGNEFVVLQMMQTDHESDALDLKQQKAILKTKLGDFRKQLDVEFSKYHGSNSSKMNRWIERTRPFHWFVEHYEVLAQRGGFDVIIGNPPYLGTKKVMTQYDVISHFNGIKFPDIYAYVVIRSLDLLKSSGRIGMIIPLSLTFGKQYLGVRSDLFQRCRINWFSSFDKDPFSLFYGVKFRHTIHLGEKKLKQGVTSASFTTRLYRCYPEARVHLFPTIDYCEINSANISEFIPKFGSEVLLNGFSRLSKVQINKQIQPRIVKNITSFPLHFKNTGYNYLTFCREKPPAQDLDGSYIDHPGFGTIYFSNSILRDIAFIFLNGKIMFAWWLVYGDAFHLIRNTINDALENLLKVTEEQAQMLMDYVPKLESVMDKQFFMVTNIKVVGNYDLLKCRHITDDIDRSFLQLWDADHLWDEIQEFCEQSIRLKN